MKRYFFYPANEKQFKQEAKNNFVRTIVFDTKECKIANNFIREVKSDWQQTCKNNIETDHRIKSLSGEHFEIYNWVVQSKSDFNLSCFIELYRKYGKLPISDIEKLIYGSNTPQSKLKTESIQTKICDCCRLKRPLSAFLTINSRICQSCCITNLKTKIQLVLTRTCECCRTEQPLSAFSDNAGFSSFKTCQRCRDVARSARNQHNKPRRSCY
jgi:sulfur relay (sulfurtransferase) DsrC/TusE family protein